MLKITKWLSHDPFRLTFDFAIDDISCLEEIGNVILKYDDDEDDEDDDIEDSEEDDREDFGWGFGSDLDDDDDEDDDEENEDEEDDIDDLDFEDMLIRTSDRWVVCEDDHYGETDSETEDAEIVN